MIVHHKHEPHVHHDPAGHEHHAHKPKTTQAMLSALIFTVGFAVLELVAGYFSNSLALISDSGHMVSDALSLALGSLAVWMGKRPPSQKHSYGLQRAEVLAALFNGILLLVVILGIVVEAILRISQPHQVHAMTVVIVSIIGMIMNTVNALFLSKMEHGLNSRAAMIHVIGDFFGSLAALIAGAVIWWTGWMPIDPILSLVVAGIMLFSTLKILNESVHVLMEGVPDGVSLVQVGDQLAHLDGVISVHDLHIWTLTSGMVALSAHLQIKSLTDWPQILSRTLAMLEREHGIVHVTLQPEVSENGI
ncbi:MAG: cation transporter [Betaproteobacteria bacterium]|uniref:cation diffusion facilitator family transporter n=1 Tax=Ferrovum sp. PN-J185 TaxID=1356306 RepID=UPI00079AFCCA|nr:cation diffusion facilitator family transporter [Ferrovum sp. PN-J185]KXW56822.1 cadmium, cobalt and zinc/H(+)-K(+) antiporter [Ferrovum sp. PN-J185]MDE2056085.1 cation transporter [Betaproteobacteria bacterium]